MKALLSNSGQCCSLLFSNILFIFLCDVHNKNLHSILQHGLLLPESEVKIFDEEDGTFSYGMLRGCILLPTLTGLSFMLAAQESSSSVVCFSAGHELSQNECPKTRP